MQYSLLTYIEMTNFGYCEVNDKDWYKEYSIYKYHLLQSVTIFTTIYSSFLEFININLSSWILLDVIRWDNYKYMKQRERESWNCKLYNNLIMWIIL